MTKKNETIFCWPDTHLDQHHRGAVANILQYVKDTQPDRILFLGDLVDFLSVGRWVVGQKDESGEILQRELDECDRLFTTIRSFYDGPIDFVQGNHEDRLEKYLARQAKGLEGLACLRITDLLEFDKHQINWRPQPFQVLPGVFAIHGERLGAKGGMSVMKEVERLGVSVVMGHCHRLGLTFRKYHDRQVFGMEAGHLQGKNSYITVHADWQMGFGLLHTYGKNQVLPQVVPIQPNGRFFIDGANYG